MINPAEPLYLAKSEALWKQTLGIIPAGGQTFSKSPSQHVEGVSPRYTVRGKGAFTWDIDGNKYLDCMAALGPIILGHAHDEVNKAVCEILKNGNLMSLNHPLETELSKELCSLIPCAEQVRFGKNGSDATSAAIRVARGYNGRDKVAVCGYHGWQDWYIGSTSRNLGVPKSVQDLTLKFKYNDIDSLYALFEKNKDEIAAVIMEPVTFDAPEDGFLQKVQELAKQNGAVLIFDEVITGFRSSIHGMQKELGVTPDIACFGKAMANGFPLSSIVGAEKFMKLFEDVFFSSTFGAEATAMAASLKTIEVLKKNDGNRVLRKRGQKFIEVADKTIVDLKAGEIVEIKGYDFWPAYIFKSFNAYNPLVLQTLFQQELVRRGFLSRAGVFFTLSHSDKDIQSFNFAFHEALDIVVSAVHKKTVEDHIDGRIIEPVIRKKQ